MNVVILQTGKTVQVNDSYGERLIEQGVAVLPKENEKPAPVKRGRDKNGAKG